MSWDKIDNHLFDKYCVEGEDKELSNLMEEHDKEIRAKAIDEFAEAIRDICYKCPIGTDADTNEPLYGHEDGTWHNLIDDVAEMTGITGVIVSESTYNEDSVADLKVDKEYSDIYKNGTTRLFKDDEIELLGGGGENE